MNPLDRKDYRELIPLYFQTKERVQSAERDDGEGRATISAIAELRSVLNHIMRTDNFFAGFLTEEEIKERTGLSVDDYLAKNINKACGHLYRASYDAYDITGIGLVDDIEKQLEDVSRKTLYSVIPDAHRKIYVPFQTGKILFTEAKTKKDVESREEEKVQFEEYEQAVNALTDVRDFVSERMTALLDYEAAEKKRENRNVKIAILIALVSLFSGSAITLIIDYFLK